MLHYQYFKDSYKMIAVHLSKQQALYADSRAIQQINFTGNLNRLGNKRIYFNLEKAKNYFNFCTGHCKSIVSMLRNNF